MLSLDIQEIRGYLVKNAIENPIRPFFEQEVYTSDLPSLLEKLIPEFRTGEYQFNLTPSPEFRSFLFQLVEPLDKYRLRRFRALAKSRPMLAFLELYTSGLSPELKEEILRGFLNKWFSDVDLPKRLELFQGPDKLQLTQQEYVWDYKTPLDAIRERTDLLEFRKHLSRLFPKNVRYKDYSTRFALETITKGLHHSYFSRKLPKDLALSHNKFIQQNKDIFLNSQAFFSLVPVKEISDRVALYYYIAQTPDNQYIITPFFANKDWVERLRNDLLSAFQLLGTDDEQKISILTRAVFQYLNFSSNYLVDDLDEDGSLRISSLMIPIYDALYVYTRKYKRPVRTYEDFIKALKEHIPYMKENYGNGVPSRILRELQKHDSPLLRFIWENYAL